MVKKRQLKFTTLTLTNILTLIVYRPPGLTWGVRRFQSTYWNLKSLQVRPPSFRIPLPLPCGLPNLLLNPLEIPIASSRCSQKPTSLSEISPNFLWWLPKPLTLPRGDCSCTILRLSTPPSTQSCETSKYAPYRSFPTPWQAAHPRNPSATLFSFIIIKLYCHMLNMHYMMNWNVVWRWLTRIVSIYTIK